MSWQSSWCRLWAGIRTDVRDMHYCGVREGAGRLGWVRRCRQYHFEHFAALPLQSETSRKLVPRLYRKGIVNSACCTYGQIAST